MSVARPGRSLTGPSAELMPLDAQANFPSQVMLGKKMLHLPDWLAIELPPHEQRVQAGEGIRSSLMLPILQGDECIGALGIGPRGARVQRQDRGATTSAAARTLTRARRRWRAPGGMAAHRSHAPTL